MGRVRAVVVVTFAIIAGVGLVLSLVFVPTNSPARLVAFLATMQAVTGATVAGLLYVALSPRQGKP
jgi:hypothetical protein